MNKVNEFIQKGFGKVTHFVKNNSSTILTICSSAGVVLTAVITANQTKKACKKIAAESFDEWREGRDISKAKKARIIFPYFIPPVLVSAATITCICCNNTINNRKQVALTAAYTLLDSQLKEYKAKVNEMYGEETDEIVRAAIREDHYKGIDVTFSGEKIVFYEEHRDEFFELRMEEVMAAEYHINRNLQLRGSVTLNEFYSFLGLSDITSGEVLGWNLNEGPACYGYSWIDFTHKKFTLDDGLEYYLIDYPFPPHIEDPDWDSWNTWPIVQQDAETLEEIRDRMALDYT